MQFKSLALLLILAPSAAYASTVETQSELPSEALSLAAPLQSDDASQPVITIELETLDEGMDLPTRIEMVDITHPVPQLVNHADGKSVIAFTIGLDGKTRDFEVVSATDKTLADHAIATIKGWVYGPPVRKGEPVEVRLKAWFAYDFQ